MLHLVTGRNWSDGIIVTDPAFADLYIQWRGGPAAQAADHTFHTKREN